MSHSLLVKLLCDEVGVQCRYISGLETLDSDGHAWNEICIDGVWYGVDTTGSNYIYELEGFDTTHRDLYNICVLVLE